MILRRLTANLRAQNWTAIAIEFLIVVIGVFIGTQVANWNQERLEKRRDRADAGAAASRSCKASWSSSTAPGPITRPAAATPTRRSRPGMAIAGSATSEFVIAAYQASQITGIGINAENWAITFGGEQLRNIEDPKVRRRHGADADVAITAPVDLQCRRHALSRERPARRFPSRSRTTSGAQCGDRNVAERARLRPDRPARACDLRSRRPKPRPSPPPCGARPDLVGELHWHLAADRGLPRPMPKSWQIPIRELHRDLSSRPDCSRAVEARYGIAHDRRPSLPPRGRRDAAQRRTGQVWVGRRIDNTDEAWQMPQGGIDKGEEPWATALRELEEETGIPPHLVERIADCPERLQI